MNIKRIAHKSSHSLSSLRLRSFLAAPLAVPRFSRSYTLPPPAPFSRFLSLAPHSFPSSPYSSLYYHCSSCHSYPSPRSSHQADPFLAHCPLSLLPCILSSHAPRTLRVPQQVVRPWRRGGGGGISTHPPTAGGPPKISEGVWAVTL